METIEEDKKKADGKEYNRLKNQRFRERNPDYSKIKSKEYRERNPTYAKIKYVEFHKNNPDYNRNYNRKNKTRRTINQRIKRQTNFIHRAIGNLRHRIYTIFKSTNIGKSKKTFDLIGCTPEMLKNHLENQFKEGMTHNNYGRNGWSIDHIIPLVSAGSDKEKAEKLCHYTNLQPLWWWENLQKGDKIPQNLDITTNTDK